MPGTFFGLSIAKSGIFTQSKAMDVTSHNIANANTEGYSRQKAVMESARPYMITSLNTPVEAQQIGSGVNVAKIQQFRDAFIDAKITKENSTLSYKSSADELLKQVESIMNEPGDTTLRGQLDKFWASWEDLSTDPSSTALRRNLVEETDTLLSQFKEMDSQLTHLKGAPTNCQQGSIESQIKDVTKEINNLAHTIADLNVQIGRSETDVNVANDLRDHRQKAVEDLSKLVNVDAFYNDNGQVTINVGAHTLVQQGVVRELNLSVKDGESATSLSGSEDYPEFSDNTEVATAALRSTGSLRNITLTVSQLAQADSKYSYLTFHPLNAPLSDFGVTSGSFKVNGRDFWVDADNMTMNDLANELNTANLDLNASLNEAGQLDLEAAQTGTKYAISAEDGTSNLITVLNLQDNQKAQDARFNFGGQEYVSSKNIVDDAVNGATIYLKGRGVANLDLRPTVTSGKLKGLMEVRDGTVQRAISDLNKLAYSIATEVNQVHRNGYGLDETMGRNFFKPITSEDPNNPYKDAIQNLDIEDDIRSNLDHIAASSGTIENPTDRLRTYNGDGDGSNAISIAQLKQTNFFDEGKSTFNDFYDEMITDVASTSERFGKEKSYSQSLMTQLDAKRQELSGVSLDEELANLIKFQHAYNASAKMVTTIDAMLDKLINGMV